MAEESDSSFDPVGHRRHQPRLQLGIAAKLETLDGTTPVQLLDLSQNGARLDLNNEQPFGSAVLHWLEFEAFGDLVWQKEQFVGLRFDGPIALGWLVTTRQLAPDVVALEDLEARKTALAWVSGRTHLGSER